MSNVGKIFVFSYKLKLNFKYQMADRTEKIEN